MKTLFRYCTAVMCAVAVFVSCGKDSKTEPEPGPVNPEVVPALTAEVVSVGASTATLKLTSTAITSCAYVVVEKADDTGAPEAAIVFADGRTVELAAETAGVAETEVVISALQPQSEYVTYFAATTVDDEFYGEVVAVELTTAEFVDTVTVFDVGYNSFKVNVKVPETVFEDEEEHKGNVIKWVMSSVVMYNMNSDPYTPDAEALNLNDEYYHNYFTKDTTLTFDEEHAFVYEDGEAVDFRYYPPVPGGRYLVLLGEFAWDDEHDDAHDRWWGDGYYNPLFDWDAFEAEIGAGQGGGDWGWDDDFGVMAAPKAVEPAYDFSKYWTGFHRAITVKLNVDSTDEKVEITTDLKPNGGVVYFNPSEKLSQYVYTLLDDETYQMCVEMFLGGDESEMQWFSTTYEAMQVLGSTTGWGSEAVNLDEVFYVQKGATYHALVVGMEDEMGTKQSFVHTTFTLPEATKPAPVMSITAVETGSPYDVCFNVKCTSKDATSFKYACNYKSEWDRLLNVGYELGDIIDQGYRVDDMDIVEAINSDAGFDLTFSSRPEMTTVCGVFGTNDEGTDGEAVSAEATTIAEPAAERVESALFTSLLGDWTATATVYYSESGWNEDFTEYVTNEYTVENKSKVTLGNVACTETLTDDVYDLYIGSTIYKTREEVDALYADLKSECETFNTKVRGQNRILCNGLALNKEFYGRQVDEYKSPYELFTSDSYNGSSNASILEDFGPKWYLQIAADGTVTAPFDAERFVPAANWGGYYYPFYFVGASSDYSLPYVSNETGKHEVGQFPVEVSADGNTITVKPLVYNGETYYPNMASSYDGVNFTFISRVVSPIVLTRGWTEEATSDAASTSKVEAAKIKSMYNVAPRTSKAMGHTPFVAKAPVKYKQVSGHVVTRDEFKNNVKSLKMKANKTARR